MAKKFIIKMCDRIPPIQHAILEKRYKFSQNRIPKINLVHYVVLLILITLLISLTLFDTGYFKNKKAAALSNDAVRFNAISTLSNLPSLTNSN